MASKRNKKKSPAAFQTALTRFYYQYAARIMTGLGVYNPSTIPFVSLKRMRDYPQIHFGLSIIKLAVLGVEKKVVCDDEDIRKFIEEEYLKPWGRRFAQKCLNGLDFGFSPIELVWTSIDYNAPKTEKPTEESEVAPRGGPKWVLNELRTPDPEQCQWLADEDGYYNGFMQSAVDLPKVPADKSVWYAYDDEFGNLYGTPATKPCYPPWYNHEMLTIFMLREAERFGSPFVKVRHPEDVAGDTTNKSAAATLGRDIKDNSYVPLSSQRDAAGDYAWDVEIVAAEGTSEHWINKLNYFNTEMFRALHIPDRVATQDEVGSEALSRTHKSIHTQNIDGIAWDITDVENEHLVKKLVEYNFDNPPTCYLKAEVLADDKREFILELCRDILKGKADRQVIEAAKEKIAEMGLELPEWEDLPEETKPEPIPPELKGKKEPMPAGEGDVLEAEAPAGWKLEFRNLSNDVRADVHKVVDEIEGWTKGLDETVKPYELPYRGEYGRVLETGALAAFDLAVGAQAKELGVTAAAPDVRDDISDRVGRVVGKQFSALSFEIGNTLARARREKFFNYGAELKDKLETFRDRADLAVDTELADAFRIGRDAVAVSFEGRTGNTVEFGRWVTVKGDEDEKGRHVYIEGGEMKTGPGGKVISREKSKKKELPRGNFEYAMNCTKAGSGDVVEYIVDNSEDISWEQFKVGVGAKTAEDIDLSLTGGGLPRLSDDYAVSYSVSKLPSGEPVYYVTHSAIEYIFTKHGKINMKLEKRALKR